MKCLDMLEFINYRDFALDDARMEEIRQHLEKREIKDGENTYSVTSSFGVASYKPEDDIDSIIKRADDALYKCKDDGRNCVRTLEPV